MILLLNIICVCFTCILCKEHLLRGVQPSNIALYDPDKDFRCLDGSQTIPFAHVNDDYCDCLDGSDEPGTSACPNGYFYCANEGYKPGIVPSSRVNDAICDCCDGSDEYAGRTQCSNDCLRLGELLRQEQERLHKMKMEGHTIYMEYAQKGRDAKVIKQARLEELLKERDEVDMERAELDKRKSEAEQPEREAKERHEKAWEEIKAKQKDEDRVVEAKEAFSSLDANQDNVVSLSEVQTRLEFDIDSNGEVSEDEAKEYLEENDEVTFEVFLEKVWDNIREIYRRPQDETKETETDSTTQETPDTVQVEAENTDGNEEAESETDDEEERDEVEDEDKYDDDDYDNYPEDDKPSGDEKASTDDADKMPDYDEETKVLIAAADEARQKYDTVDAKFRKIEDEIRDIKKVVEQDLGPNIEFYNLMDQCFDFTDREYTYTLCPFDRAAQRSKHGGSETSLGTWGVWTGPADNKYSEMKYEHGQNCWNGPDRSATVSVNCGVSNELVSVSEPNRCEYRFIFNSPAACSQPPHPLPPHSVHTEL